MLIISSSNLSAHLLAYTVCLPAERRILLSLSHCWFRQFALVYLNERYCALAKCECWCWCNLVPRTELLNWTSCCTPAGRRINGTIYLRLIAAASLICCCCLDVINRVLQHFSVHLFAAHSQIAWWWWWWWCVCVCVVSWFARFCFCLLFPVSSCVCLPGSLNYCPFLLYFTLRFELIPFFCLSLTLWGTAVSGNLSLLIWLLFLLATKSVWRKKRADACLLPTSWTCLSWLTGQSAAAVNSPN